MILAAQLKPAASAKILLIPLLCIAHGCRIKKSPMPASVTASHCSGRIRSSSSSQASSRVQNGMVKASTAILPAPPCTSATCTKPMKPAVCSSPSSSVSQKGGGRNERPVAASTTNKHTAASTLRIAEKAKGPEYSKPCFITTQL